MCSPSMTGKRCNAFWKKSRQRCKHSLCRRSWRPQTQERSRPPTGPFSPSPPPWICSARSPSSSCKTWRRGRRRRKWSVLHSFCTAARRSQRPCPAPSAKSSWTWATSPRPGRRSGLPPRPRRSSRAAKPPAIRRNTSPSAWRRVSSSPAKQPPARRRRPCAASRPHRQAMRPSSLCPMAAAPSASPFPERPRRRLGPTRCACRWAPSSIAGKRRACTAYARNRASSARWSMRNLSP